MHNDWEDNILTFLSCSLSLRTAALERRLGCAPLVGVDAVRNDISSFYRQLCLKAHVCVTRVDPCLTPLYLSSPEGGSG